jgi:peptidoglycan/LPS O-acetylase OafA/YrhL
VHLYQDLPSLGAVLTFACLFGILLLRRRRFQKNGRWEVVLVVVGLICASAAVVGVIHG